MHERLWVRGRCGVVVGLLGSLAVAGTAWGQTWSADSETRVALVIGNSAYTNVASLPNPSNDAGDVAAALERLGFDVTRVSDVDRAGMMTALRSFSRRSAAAAVALVFYAGHGVELDGTNYLVPVDANLEWDTDVQYEAVPLDSVLSATEGVGRLRVVILDACRNNPFAVRARNPTRGMRIGRGLAEIDNVPSGRNILVAYATAAGAVADDGDARNSPFTGALLQHLEEPNVELHMMFRRVTDTVLADTNQQQQPYLYASLSAEPYYLSTASTGTIELMDAAAERLSGVLGRPLSATERDENGWTDLHYAAALNMPAMVGPLMDQGAAVGASLLTDGAGFSSRLRQTLSELGGNMGPVTRDGASPLHLAARMNGREVADALLARGASLLARTAAGRTPLHEAAAANSVEVIELLLAAGGNVHARDNVGNTPLHLASMASAAAAMAELAAGGADVQATNDRGRTPFELLPANTGTSRASGEASARRPGATDPVEAGPAVGDRRPIVDRRGRADTRGGEVSTEGSSTGLDSAREGDVSGGESVAAIRLRAILGRELSPTGVDANGWTDLHYAALVNSPGLIEMLIDRGASANVQLLSDRQPLSPLLRRRLSELEYDFSNWTRDGETPLHLAAWVDAREAVEALIDGGADLEAKTHYAWTPLHYAAVGGAHGAMQTLMSRGADDSAENTDGETPDNILNRR